MTQPERVLSLEGIEKSFSNIKVLKKVSFSVKKGKIFALLGENGAGKTTVIKILTMLLTPDGGRESVNGYDVVQQQSSLPTDNQPSVKNFFNPKVVFSR